MHFKRRGKRGRNDGSSKKRHNREKSLFKRHDRRLDRYERKRELKELKAECLDGSTFI